jgi:hypothetical protein
MAKKDKDTPDFSSILDTPATEVTRPKPIPQGTYLGMTKGLPRYDRSTKKGTPFSEYTIQLLEAQKDVDEDALREALTKGNGEIIPLRERSLRLTFYHTPDALWRLVKFLKDLGLEAEDDKVSVGDLEQESPGRQVYVHVKHTPSDDGETMFANIDKTAPVD